MNTKGIIFGPEMVQAIRQGLKTKTRRIIKPQPIDNTEVDGNFFEGDYKGCVKVDGHPDWQKQFAYSFCPYGGAGDRLYVKETYAINPDYKPNSDIPAYFYKADYAEGDRPAGVQWKSSLFMPRHAARIWLEITDTTIAQLGNMTITDAIAEGFPWLETDRQILLKGASVKVWDFTPHSRFVQYWEKIYKHSWTADLTKWVYVISYKQITKP
jgi:hypothetical protein